MNQPQANQENSALPLSLGHEIRTRMNAIKGLAELLVLGELTATQRGYVQNLIQSADSLLELLNGALEPTAVLGAVGRAGPSFAAGPGGLDDSDQGLRLKDAQLLVVDDNEINLMVSEEMLRTYAAKVDTAAGGQEALELCAQKPFDLIFLDHIMPGVDGLEVAARLRAVDGPNRHTPLVALTANLVDDVENYYAKAGMNDYIPKPVEFPELSRVLARWLPEGKIQA